MQDLKKYDSSNRIPVIRESIEKSFKNNLEISMTSFWINVKDELTMLDYTLIKPYKTALQGLTKEMVIPEKYYYRPEWLCLDVYGSTDMWYVILWLNDIFTVTEFRNRSIILLDSDGVSMLFRIINEFKSQVKKTRNEPFYLEDLTLKKIVT